MLLYVVKIIWRLKIASCKSSLLSAGCILWYEEVCGKISIKQCIQHNAYGREWKVSTLRLSALQTAPNVLNQ